MHRGGTQLLMCLDMTCGCPHRCSRPCLPPHAASLLELERTERIPRTRPALVALAGGLLNGIPCSSPSTLQYIVLDLPCSFFSLRSLR